jgi:superfamily II DNA/RNA helicase
MSFKKILPEVKEALAGVEITDVSEFGKQLFSTIKSGSHILAVAPKNTGKTKAAIVACFNKVNKELDGAPRVLYVCSGIDESIRIFELMSQVARPLDVTIDLAHDKGDQVKQRNDIFNGTEMIVGTIKRIFDLYVQNGINVQSLDYLIFDDLDELLTQGKVMEIKRLIDGVNKTQVICLANETSSRVLHFAESKNLNFKFVAKSY